MKKKLIVEFGDKFKTTVEDPKEVETSQSTPAYTSQQDPFVNPPLIRTTTVVDRFEAEPTQTHLGVTLKQTQRQVYS